MAKVIATVVSSVHIGSRTNEDFGMGIMTTNAGIFVTSTLDNPEMVEMIAKTRTGDMVEVEMYEPFTSKPRELNSGDVINEATCGKFVILNVNNQDLPKPSERPFMERTAKTKIVGKGKGTAPKDQENKDQASTEEDWGQK